VRAMEAALFRPSATLLHEGPGANPGPSCYLLFLPAKRSLCSVWACLDSNQGPLPYQRSALTG
jgi:hypothetical protein